MAHGTPATDAVWESYGSPEDRRRRDAYQASIAHVEKPSRSLEFATGARHHQENTEWWDSEGEADGHYDEDFKDYGPRGPYSDEPYRD